MREVITQIYDTHLLLCKKLNHSFKCRLGGQETRVFIILIGYYFLSSK